MASPDKRDMFNFDEARNALEERDHVITSDLENYLEERKKSVENTNYNYLEKQESSSLQNRITDIKSNPCLVDSSKKQLTWRDPDFQYERKTYSNFKEKGLVSINREKEARQEMQQRRINTDEPNSSERDTLQLRFRDHFLPTYEQRSRYNGERYSRGTRSSETRDTWRSSSSGGGNTWKPSFSENGEACHLGLSGKNKLNDLKLPQDNKIRSTWQSSCSEARDTWATSFGKRQAWEVTSITDKSYVKNKDLGYFQLICDTETIRDDGGSELEDVWLKLNQLNDDMDGLFSKRPSMSNFLNTDKTEIRCYTDSSDLSYVSEIATTIRSRLDCYPFTFCYVTNYKPLYICTYEGDLYYIKKPGGWKICDTLK